MSSTYVSFNERSSAARSGSEETADTTRRGARQSAASSALRGRGVLLAALAALLCTLAPLDARSACPQFHDLQMQALDQLIGRNPHEAAAEIDRQLNSARTNTPGSSARLAALYALKAEAQSALDLSDEAAQSAARGLQVATDLNDAVHINLLRQYWSSIQDRTRFAEGIATLATARAPLKIGSPPELCLLSTEAILNYRANHIDLAISQLTHVYKSATTPATADARLAAAVFLTVLLRHIGEFSQALSLSREVMDCYQKRGDTFGMATTHFNQGKIYAAMHEPVLARSELMRAESQARQLGDEEGVAFAEQTLCSVEVELGQLNEARRDCDSASASFGKNHDTDMLKRTESSRAEIERLSGHPTVALKILQQTFADDASGVSDRDLAPLYLQRARLYETLGNYRSASHDLNIYVQMQASLLDTQRSQQIAAMRAELEVDREIERNAALQRELMLSNRIHRQQRDRLLWITGGSMVAALLIGTWLWHRRLNLKARAASAERLAAIGRLTGGIAHDFNNLLTVQQQALGLLEGSAPVAGDAVALDLLQQAKRACCICSEITSQLLSFSRQQNLRPQAVEIDRYLRDVLPLLERAAGAAVSVRIDIQESAPVAWADQRLLTAALLNLVSNARDAMSGGGTVTIHAATDVTRRVRLDVIDEGCGMTPEVLSRAIEPFYSTKPVGSGSGLGLSMVEGFASQSGGAFAIRSELKRGTTVSLWLPAAEALT